jgi:hypothetical protein
MNAHETVAKRFTELERQFQKLSEIAKDFVPGGPWYAWSTSVLDLLEGILPANSPYVRTFRVICDQHKGFKGTLAAAGGVFYSAKGDFEAGYLKQVEALFTGEVLGDFVALARRALADGHHTVAAVLAAAALEDALKRYATANDLSVHDKVMQEVVAALKAKGLVSGAQKQLLDTMPKLRDYAMHANWDKIQPPDVASIIGFVEQFLLTHFA